MSKLSPLSPPTGDLKEWAEQVTTSLRELIDRTNRPYPQIVQLQPKDPGAKALADGLMMWDATEGCPVVSRGGVWRKVALV